MPTVKESSALLFSFAIIIFACSRHNNTDGEANSSSSQTSGDPDSLSYQEKTYKTVKIGRQIWFAENLNAMPTTGNSVCYGEYELYCDKYGKLYDWEAANNVCPDNWKLPSKNDFDVLLGYVENKENGFFAGYVLKSANGWGESNGGSDLYNFSALPGGLNLDGSFSMIEKQAYWWTSTGTDDLYAYYRCITNEYLRSGPDKKTQMFSVRCIKK